LLIIIPSIIFFVTINSFENIKNRFTALLNPDNYEVSDNYWNSIGSRVTALKCTFEIFERSPLIGTGIGDLQNDLDVCNDASDFQTLKGMNPHNQFFQFLVGTGLTGMLYFIFLLAYLFVRTLKQKNSLYFYFICLFTLCCFTESLLERQYGIMFFSFFHSLLLNYHGDRPEKATIFSA
jgi:O-antigen ligase